jgi:ABC-2 type transport system ATP-binding protein
MSEPLIALENVGKAYRFFELCDVSLRLEPGQIMGLVGPNGAGKSTLIRILMGLVTHDRGRVRVLGQPIPAGQAIAKQEIGFVSEDMGLYRRATVGWHMRFIASIYPGWDADYARTLLRRFSLKPEQPVGALSRGERVKTAILLALARRPRLLVLDEPTTGLDPVARHEVLTELVAVLADDRRSILFSSHNTQDVEQVSDLITFIDRGRVIESCDKESFLERWRRIQLDVPPGAALPAMPGDCQLQTSGRLATLTTNAYGPELEAALGASGALVRDVQRMTLEEIFVATVMNSRKEDDGE